MEENMEELNFLKEELKKINTRIEEFGYGPGNLGTQAKLWELKDKIEGKIDEFIKSHQARENKPKRKGTAMSA